VLLRGAREAKSDEDRGALERAAAQLANCLRQVGRQDNLESLRGKEGEAARIYFGAFNRLIRAEGFEFSGRNRRPPRDPVNALLSFAYVLLASQMVGALEGVGLDPAAGFLHRERPGRPSLALDMIEPMRAPLADRFVLALINLRQVQPKGFTTTASGAVEMDEKTKKIFLTAWEERKHEELQHPFLGEKFSLGLLPHAQALLLARHLRGDLDAYPPHFWK
jgi:CRISPR-associated protein Cas1